MCATCARNHIRKCRRIDRRGSSIFDSFPTNWRHRIRTPFHFNCDQRIGGPEKLVQYLYLGQNNIFYANYILYFEGAVNFLIADGKRFAHPLHHLGKSEQDLPLIAIDSFRHMYLFPEFKQLTEYGKLRQFVLDLHSGKLHREFHQGPDPTPENPNQRKVETQPPPSVFNKLKPAENRLIKKIGKILINLCAMSLFCLISIEK